MIKAPFSDIKHLYPYLLSAQFRAEVSTKIAQLSGELPKQPLLKYSGVCFLQYLLLNLLHFIQIFTRV